MKDGKTGFKEIWAVLRSSNMAQETKKELLKAGIAYTRFRAYGRGKQAGLYQNKMGEAANLAPVAQFLPRTIFYMVIPDSKYSKAIDILIRINQTKSFGDGKIFVGKLKQVLDCKSED